MQQTVLDKGDKIAVNIRNTQLPCVMTRHASHLALQRRHAIQAGACAAPDTESDNPCTELKYLLYRTPAITEGLNIIGHVNVS